jgi:uncharacterized membrane protein YebE (DUF533 family)
MSELQQKAELLYKEYHSETKTILSFEQFTSIVMSFPALCVALADGIIDKEERFFLASISESLVNDDYSNPQEKLLYTSEFYHQLLHLSNNLGHWKEKMLSLLTESLKEDSEGKDFIKKMMFDVAESSNGIDDAERKIIEELQKKLNIN